MTMIRDEWKSLFLLADAESKVPSPLLGQGSVTATWDIVDEPSTPGLRLRLSNSTVAAREVSLPSSWTPGRVGLPPFGVVWVDVPQGWDARTVLGYWVDDEKTMRRLAPVSVPEHEQELTLLQSLPVFVVRRGELQAKLLFRNLTGMKQTLKGALVWPRPGASSVTLEFPLRVLTGLRAETVVIPWQGPLLDGLHPVMLGLEGGFSTLHDGKRVQRHFSLQQPALLWVDTTKGELDTESLRLDLQAHEGGHVGLELGLRRTGGQQNRIDLVWSKEDALTPHWQLEALSANQTRSETLMARIPVQRLEHLLHQGPRGWHAVWRHTDDEGVECRHEVPLSAHALHILDLTLPRLPLLGPCRLQVEPRKLEAQTDCMNTGVEGLPADFTIFYSFPNGLSGEKQMGPWFRAPRAGRPIITGQTTFRLTYELKDWLAPRLSRDHRHLELGLKPCAGCTLEPEWELEWMGDEVEGSEANQAVLSISSTSLSDLSWISCHIKWGSRRWDARLLLYQLAKEDGTRLATVQVNSLRDRVQSA